MSTLDAVTLDITATADGRRSPGPRHLLRAYTHGNAIRLAAILHDLSAPTPPIRRERIVQSWAQRWPDHLRQTHRNTVRARIAHAVGLLRAAGICAPYADSTDITVTDHRLLAIAAGNLDIIVGDNGHDQTPGFWRGAIVVPDDLRPLADELAAQALARTQG